LLIRLIAIAKNTFIETLRQPIYAVLIIFALLMLALAPSIAMYTLDEDIKLLRELGLSTIFLAGLFIAVFASTGAITEEIESGTITTVLSKPISRPVFVLGKFFGIVASVTLAHILITMAYLMIARHGVLEAASDEIDWTVITAGGTALLLTLIITAAMNYVYDWNFPATGVVIGTITASLATLFLVFVDKHWQFNPAENHFEMFDITASTLLLMAIFILTAVAILFSTRFNEVITLTICIGVFLLGLISDWIFGRFADHNIWAKIGTILTPNLQIVWISDAIYEGAHVPAQYLGMVAVYTTLYTAGILALAVASFQRRQIG
jgi:ABC-type transport system involved in multi-copper enzyme maturation permease subunit